MRVDEHATKVARARHALGVKVLNLHFGAAEGGPWAFSGRRPAPMSRAGLLAYRRHRDKVPSGYRLDRGFVARRRRRKAARAARKVNRP